MNILFVICYNILYCHAIFYMCTFKNLTKAIQLPWLSFKITFSSGCYAWCLAGEVIERRWVLELVSSWCNINVSI